MKSKLREKIQKFLEVFWDIELGWVELNMFGLGGRLKTIHNSNEVECQILII